LHGFEFGGDSSQAGTCHTHGPCLLESTLLNFVGNESIGDPAEAKRSPAIDKAASALMRECFGGSLGDSFTFPLCDNPEHVDDQTTSGGLSIKRLLTETSDVSKLPNSSIKSARSRVDRVILSSLQITTREIAPRRR
jgi:hypothetical protein